MNNITSHVLWLWLWFAIGMLFYMLKRAYYLVTGPNPVATSYGQFVTKCWIPLTFRMVVDSGLFWMSFYPQFLNPLLSHFGISFQLSSPMVEMPGPICLFVGLGIDSAVDFIVSKVPGLNTFLPQMPPPLVPPLDGK